MAFQRQNRAPTQAGRVGILIYTDLKPDGSIGPVEGSFFYAGANASRETVTGEHHEPLSEAPAAWLSTWATQLTQARSRVNTEAYG